MDNAWSALTSAVRLTRGSRVRGRAVMPERVLELWEFESCPFCRKVREVMSELDLEYISHPVGRGSMNRDATPSYRGGRKSYPYLVDANTDVAMKESEDIIDYLHRTYGDGRGTIDRWLAPLNTFGSFAASAIRPRGGVARRRSKQPEKRLVLYQFEGCPYCRKVREKLCELDLDYHVKNTAKGSRRRAELRELGTRTVPFLIDPNTGVSMGESDDIRRYLEETYGSDSGHHTASP